MGDAVHQHTGASNETNDSQIPCNDSNENPNNGSNDSSGSKSGGEINYKTCCLYKKQFGDCGPFLRDRKRKDGVVGVTNLTADTSNHFKSLHLKDYLANMLWTERRIIESWTQ